MFHNFLFILNIYIIFFIPIFNSRIKSYWNSLVVGSIYLNSIYYFYLCAVSFCHKAAPRCRKLIASGGGFMSVVRIDSSGSL